MGSAQSTETKNPAQCPVDHSKFGKSADELNPRNMMPDLKQERAPNQRSALSLERTISSIPRAKVDTPSACPVNHDAPVGGCPVKHDGKTEDASPDQWEYPSSQQFYNALVRKGWETPEESIDTMVQIHNWLNEQAWNLILKWETAHPGGDKSQLAHFRGRPNELSPKARYHLFMAQLFPNTYAGVKPFDRHDWVIHRPTPTNSEAAYTSPSSTQPYTEHRYVIDYYQLADDRNGNPVFSLDARPAVDSLEAIQDRLWHWYEEKRNTFFQSGDNTDESQS